MKIFKFLAAAAAACLLAIPARAQLGYNTDDARGLEIRVNPAQPVGFYGVKPVPQESDTNDLLSSIKALGLISTSGSDATPLHLHGGFLTAGQIGLSLGSGTGATLNVLFMTGTASPIAAAVVAKPGTHYFVNTGAAGAEYIKLSGTGGTGWGLVTTGTGP